MDHNRVDAHQGRERSAVTAQDDRAITFSIVELASGSSRLSAPLRPRSAGLTALTRSSVEPQMQHLRDGRQVTANELHKVGRSE